MSAGVEQDAWLLAGVLLWAFPWAYQGGKGRVRCMWVLRAVHVSMLVSTDVRSYGSENQGLGKVGLQGTLGGGAAQIYV